MNEQYYNEEEDEEETSLATPALDEGKEEEDADTGAQDQNPEQTPQSQVSREDQE